mgnify:CR=1 FL=1
MARTTFYDLGVRSILKENYYPIPLALGGGEEMSSFFKYLGLHYPYFNESKHLI